MCAQVPGGNEANIVARHLLSRFKPFQYVVCDCVGNAVRLSLGSASAERGGGNALM